MTSLLNYVENLTQDEPSFGVFKDVITELYPQEVIIAELADNADDALTLSQLVNFATQNYEDENVSNELFDNAEESDGNEETLTESFATTKQENTKKKSFLEELEEELPDSFVNMNNKTGLPHQHL